MNSRARVLWFTGPGRVEVREQALPEPGAGQVRVRTVCSAISAGTELLAYRGQLPEGLALDGGLDAFKGKSAMYPFQYGYACAGIVEAAGEDVAGDIEGRLVFAFAPHATRFIADAAGLIPLSEAMTAETGVFTANMETAVNLLHDGRPLAGEQVAVLGLGVVGQLVTGLLARFPLGGLRAVDRIEKRINAAAAFGGVTALHHEAVQTSPEGGEADLVFELSGNPEALNQAIALCGFDSRIVIGSWYGSKTAPADLGGRFHRNRIQILSSQVSTIASGLSGRWDKARRFAAVLDLLPGLEPARLITHRIPFDAATDAYRLLDEAPDECLQVVLTYE